MGEGLVAASFFVSVASALFALVSVLQSRKTAREQKEIQRQFLSLQEEQTELHRQQVEMEEQQKQERKRHSSTAQVEAKLEQGEHQDDGKIVVRNTGQARARSIRLLVNDKKPSEQGFIYTKVDEIKDLASGGEFTFTVGMAWERDRPPWDIALSWDDDAGGGEWKSSVKL